jgi:hypothetical protein
MPFLLPLLLALGSLFAPRPFVWPVDPPQVVRRFDPPPQPWLAGHRGVDLAAPPGSIVRAAGAGTIAFAGRIAGRGVVSVAHSNGLRTTYEPAIPAVSSPPACTGACAAESNTSTRSRCSGWAGSACYRCRALSSGGRRSASRSYSSGRL